MLIPTPFGVIAMPEDRVMLVSDLHRGAYSGKETFLYDNSGTHAAPVWEEIVRARNIQVNDGPSLNDVEFHGAQQTSQIPGYTAFNGSFEYVRRKGTDTVYDRLKIASEAGTIVDMVHLNGTILLTESVGWRSPVLLGEFAETDNGSDPVVVTIPFAKADAYDDSEDAIDKVPFTGTTPGP
jgi:hypothetical protein